MPVLKVKDKKINYKQKEVGKKRDVGSATRPVQIWFKKNIHKENVAAKVVRYLLTRAEDFERFG